MAFADLIDQLIRQEYRGVDAAFLKATGLTTAHLGSWRKRQTKQPHMDTLEQIEKAAGIRFSLDASGIPIKWEKVSEPSPAIYTARPKLPGSAREEYEALEFAEGKPDWLDLPDAERSFYEGLFKRMEMEYDRAIEEHEERVRSIIHEFRKLMHGRMLGIG